MTLKQLWNNIKKPKNLIHLVWGFYLSFIKKQYEKHFTEDKLEDIFYKIAKCPQCYLAGECIGTKSCNGCGCSSQEMFFTDKQCVCGHF